MAGLSTELADVSEVEYRQLRLERVAGGVWTEGPPPMPTPAWPSLPRWPDRGSEVLEGMIQQRDKPTRPPTSARARPPNCAPDRSGHRRRHRHLVTANSVRPNWNALEKVVKVKVIDRTALILDIFAQHATSREGQGAGRTGPDAVHAAQAARLG